MNQNSFDSNPNNLNNNPNSGSTPKYTNYNLSSPTKSFNPQKTIEETMNVTNSKLKKKRSRTFRTFAFIANFIWIMAIVLMLVKLFAFQHVQVEGRSSFPNYDTGQYLLMNQLDKNFVRGQVVAAYAIRNFAFRVNFEMNPFESFVSRFDCPSTSNCPAKFYLKRVIGLPGECVKVDDFMVIVFTSEQDKIGRKLVEPYINISEDRGSRKTIEKLCLDKDEFFLMGDNRGNSNDSRELGAFKNYQIFGKEFVRFQPLEKFRFFELPKYNF